MLSLLPITNNLKKKKKFSISHDCTKLMYQSVTSSQLIRVNFSG